MKRFTCLIVFVISLSTISLVGCGGQASDAPDTVPVSGTVTLNGTPLPGATIYFMTPEFTGSARTDDDGSYRLQKGAISGTNRVYVTKVDGGAAANPDLAGDTEQLMAAGGGRMPEDVKQLVPPEYSDPVNTTLEIDVPLDGTSSADFDL